jgi:hypothetical protein
MTGATPCCGELLRQIPAAKNQHDAASRGAPTRTEAATNAGLSRDQRVTAGRPAGQGRG